MCYKYAGLHSSVGRAQQQKRRGHGFESRWSPAFFFRAKIWNCLNCKYNCNDDIFISSVFLQFKITVIQYQLLLIKSYYFSPAIGPVILSFLISPEMASFNSTVFFCIQKVFFSCRLNKIACLLDVVSTYTTPIRLNLLILDTFSHGIDDWVAQGTQNEKTPCDLNDPGWKLLRLWEIHCKDLISLWGDSTARIPNDHTNIYGCLKLAFPNSPCPLS